MKDRVNNVKSAVVVPKRVTTLQALQEHVNQKIPEVTRDQTVSDGEHRDELPQTRRRKTVSVRDETENCQDEDETNKSNTETVVWRVRSCETGSKSIRRVFTSLVETTPEKIVLTMALVIRISRLARE